MHKHMHKRDARAHAQAHTCTKNKTSILSDASPKRPPGFPAGPNTVEAAQRSRVVTGQELPAGLAPTQTWGVGWWGGGGVGGGQAKHEPHLIPRFQAPVVPLCVATRPLLSFCDNVSLERKQVDRLWGV